MQTKEPNLAYTPSLVVGMPTTGRAEKAQQQVVGLSAAGLLAHAVASAEHSAQVIVAQAPVACGTWSQQWRREHWAWAAHRQRAEEKLVACRTPRRWKCHALVQWHQGICKTISKQLHLCVLREGAPLGE